MICLVLLLSFAGVYGKVSDPMEILSKKDRELQSLLKSDSSQTEKGKQEISRLINGIFNLEELGRKSLGSATFKKMTEEQKKRFLSAFKNILETNTMEQLESYQTDSVVYEKAKVSSSGKKAKITAHAYFRGKETIYQYKMMLKDEEWKTWDLVIDDLSTYLNYKEQFRKILKKKTIEELIERLEKKVSKKADKESAKDPVKPTEKKTKKTKKATAK